MVSMQDCMQTVLFQINPDDTHCIVDSTYNAGQTLLGLGRILTGAKVKVMYGPFKNQTFNLIIFNKDS